MKKLARSTESLSLDAPTPAAGAADKGTVGLPIVPADPPAAAWAETQPGYHVHRFPEPAGAPALDDQTRAPPQV